jgi:hypothetical protein
MTAYFLKISIRQNNFQNRIALSAVGIRGSSSDLPFILYYMLIQLLPCVSLYSVHLLSLHIENGLVNNKMLLFSVKNSLQCESDACKMFILLI